MFDMCIHWDKFKCSKSFLTETLFNKIQAPKLGEFRVILTSDTK